MVAALPSNALAPIGDAMTTANAPRIQSAESSFAAADEQATTTSSTTSTSTSTTQQPVSPREYVKRALDFIEKYSFRRKAVDWPTIRSRAEARAATATTFEATYPIISDTIDALEDHHSSFVRPVVAARQTSGAVLSFGFIALWPSRIVATVVANGPAERAGLKVGDRIDRVNDGPPGHKDGNLSIKRNDAGELPNTITLLVRRKKVKRPIRLKLELAEVTLVSIPTAAVVTTPPQVGVPLGPELGLLVVPGVVGDTAAQASYAQELQDSIRTTDTKARCGWIVDLRRNRGGYIYAMAAGLGPLLGNDVFGGRIDADGVRSNWSYKDGVSLVDGQPAVSVPRPYNVQVPEPAVAVLISTLTASAGEATAISFRGRPNTRSFGEPTAGLTTFNVRLVLPDGAFLDITNSADIDRAGNVYTGPIQPDQAMTVDWVHVNDSLDPVLNAAQAWVAQQPSCRATP
jgi:carboxyl-terminal processing protease